MHYFLAIRAAGPVSIGRWASLQPRRTHVGADDRRIAELGEAPGRRPGPPDGYAVSDGGATTTGTLICTPDNCKLSAVIAWSDSSIQYQQSTNMTLDMHDGISGNGTVSVADGTTTCNLAFTVTGSKS